MITVEEFKTFFDRGQFTYSETLPDIRDKDITNAISEKDAILNDGIYPDDETLKLAEYYLTAHFLTLDTEASESGGQPSFNQTGRSADGISESLQIPEWMNDGEFAFYATTYYGQKWLMLTKPYLGGAVYTVLGATTP